MRKQIYITLLSALLFFGAGTIKAQVIALRLPDTTSVQGRTVDIPVYIDNTLTGRNVLSYQLQVDYNPYYMKAVSVITTGTISAQMQTPNVNTSESGRITIAAAGTTALTGLGKFIYIRFNLLNAGWSYLNFSDTRNNIFNEGSPAVSLQNNGINIDNKPVITISPNQDAIAKGDQLQMEVGGGTAPYQWFVTNTSVASIDANGMLTALQSGTTKVVVQDNDGTRDTTSGYIAVRAIKLTVTDTLSEWPGAILNVPVLVTSVNGLNITSGSFSLSADTNYLKPLGIVQVGTILSSYGAPTTNIEPDGTVRIGFAGSTALSGSGVLIYVQYRVSNRNDGNCAINLSDILFNQDILSGYENGLFTIKGLSTLNIAPSIASIVVGRKQQFSVDGNGITPYKWSVSDTSKASINSSGLLIAKKIGVVRVQVTDSVGSKAISGDIKIYDAQMELPEMKTCLASPYLYYPVLIDTIAGSDPVFSVEMKLNYDTNFFKFVDILRTGMLTENWSLAQHQVDKDLNIAVSGTSGFKTKGTLFKIRFEYKPSFAIGNQVSMEVRKFVLNEGNPSVLIDTYGSILGENLRTPYINLDKDTLYSDMKEGNQWYLFDGNTTTQLNGETSRILIPKVSGTYFSIISDTSGCVSDTSNQIDVSSTTINTDKSSHYQIFPNPSYGIFYINLGQNQKYDLQIGIINSLGQEVLKITNSNQSEKVLIDLMNRPKGVYFVNIRNKDEIRTEKLILR